MATLTELQAQLVEVNEAISAVLTAQSYKFNDGQAEQWVVKADLPNLIALRKDLELEIIDDEDEILEEIRDKKEESSKKNSFPSDDDEMYFAKYLI